MIKHESRNGVKIMIAFAPGVLHTIIQQIFSAVASSVLSYLFSNGAGTDSCPAIRVRLSSACLYVNPTLMKSANGMDTWRS